MVPAHGARSSELMKRRGRTVVLLAILVATLSGALTTVAFLGVPDASAAAAWSPAYEQDSPDPSVLFYEGTYYEYATQSYDLGKNIQGATSPDGVTWTDIPTDLMPVLPDWVTPGFTWAPSVEVNVQGQFVMYFAARDTASGSQCLDELSRRQGSNNGCRSGRAYLDSFFHSWRNGHQSSRPSSRTREVGSRFA